MSYENAPATAMLATECACCGRPLLDAVSVEAGVGPDCRAKYGYGEQQGPADWTRAEELLGSHVRGAALAHAWGADAQAAANALVHAVGANAAAHGDCVAAIGALGFTKLAAKLVDRAHGIVVEEADGLLRVKTPFSPAFNDAVHRVPGQRWIKAEKVRVVPTSSRVALWAALKAVFPRGTVVSGPKGLAVL